MRLIDADALLEPIADCEERETCDGCPYKDCEDFERLVKAAPTIEPVKVGRWKRHPFEPDWDVCTACGQGTKRREHGRGWMTEQGYRYCPWCGAKMEAKKE